jgi:flagellar assembly protein FliH
MDSASKPFLFDKSFDLSAIKAAEEARQVKTYTEEELALAKEQAHGAGFVAGKEAAMREIEQQQSSLLGNINRLFERLANDVWKVYAQQKQVASEVGVTIARKIVPDYLQKNGQQEIMTAIESCLAEVINEPRLVLRVNEKHFDYIKREVDQTADRLGYAGKMIILADQNLTEHDCRLEWADGGMERNINLTWSEIDKQIARHGGNTGNQSIPPAARAGSEASTSTTTLAV